MTESLDTRRKRMLYRCHHRGTKELDLLLGSFAERHIAGMSTDQLDRFERLMEVPEPLLFGWIVGREAPAPEFDDDVMHLLRSFQYKPLAG